MSTVPSETKDHGVADDDTDAILAELEAEAEDTSSAAYQQRLSELQATALSSNAGSGVATANVRKKLYVDLNSDDETLQFTTEHAKAVVHFCHPDFARCAIMDEHLDSIAQKHSGEASGEDIAFGRVNVTATPFIVEKLGVRVLPCVIGFAGGIVKGKVVGFEGICWDSNEKHHRVTKSLEDTLFSWGLLTQKLMVADDESDSDDEDRRGGNRGGRPNARRGIRNTNHNMVAEDDDWD